jgi:Ca2+-transporting ATPase
MNQSSGLTENEAKKRLARYGFNELPTAVRQSVLKILFRVLQEPMLLLLLSCGFIYLLTGGAKDGILLFASAVVVVSITLYQEVKSERALEALRDLSSPRALVIREGVTRRIPGREVVPGDLVRVAEGDRVPADAVLLSTTHLSVDESLLTGESFAVTKTADTSFRLESSQAPAPQCHLFSGTLVIGGQGLAAVLSTGAKTELGKIGRSLETVKKTPTPLQLEVNRMIRVFGMLGVSFSIAIALVYGMTRGDWPKGILAGLAAAMSLLPEEFPVVMTVFLAMGAWRISRKNVLTRRVAAIEALGSVSVLCVDKTGTLTQNRMSVRNLEADGRRVDLMVDSDLEPRFTELLEIASLACHENPFDPMEKAILEAQTRFGQSKENTSPRERRMQYPLSSGLLAMSCVWKLNAQETLTITTKGAPEAILQLCHFGRIETQTVLSQVQQLASRGLRVLAVARGEYPDVELPQNQHDFDFKFLGLLTLEDPIRPEVPAAIQECRDAGIRVIMLTGDFPETAKSIAEQLKLPGQVFSGGEISRTDDLKLQETVRNTSVFARVTPEQKLRIVTALRAVGERVAMTGDGVNDAPSLKWADIGIAMGRRGTDVAREAAAIVLLDDSFTSMVASIRLGRRIYDNLQKAVFFILAIHVPIAGLAILPVVLKLPLLLLPAHIVFLELIIDPACSLIYEAEQEEPDVMTRKPRSADAALVQPKDFAQTILEGGVILGLVMALYIGLLKMKRTGEEARTAAFLALILCNLGLILVSRVRTGGIIRTLMKRNFPFDAVAIGALVLLALILSIESIRSLFGFAPLPGEVIAIAISVGAISLIMGNGIRVFFNRRGGHC